MFINTVLINCEIWHGLKETDLADIKLIDNQLMHYICSAHAKKPKEFLFLKTGALSISHIISSRRLNYLWEILSRNEDELVRKKRFLLHSKKNFLQEILYISLPQENSGIIPERTYRRAIWSHHSELHSIPRICNPKISKKLFII